MATTGATTAAVIRLLVRARSRARCAAGSRRATVAPASVADAYLAELLDTTGGGGIGYLLKDRVGHVRDFLDSLDRVAGGETVVDPQVVRGLLSRHQPDGPLDVLSEREREVLALMAEGRTNGSIATALFVSEAAVRKHVGNIFAKLRLDPNTDRRVSAVLAYLREA